MPSLARAPPRRRRADGAVSGVEGTTSGLREVGTEAVTEAGKGTIPVAVVAVEKERGKRCLRQTGPEK
ncbi:hypothetical protein U9M48_020354 [Paspalum notatum var. saurae]|uniref:Uncharacterized protein n=1 Tax=Paspalum notatum var. saurae TaxID=547442 RepID=A0AAQ3TD67_PASNO